MTRIEAIAKYNEIDKRVGIKPFWEVNDIINKIFDDFESKTCDNCEHYINRSCMLLGCGDIGGCGDYFEATIKIAYCNGDN